ncbi:transglutaminase domain-containing protein [bacterium]|nr:transglutaminase domain-containing protein [bacterium]
MILLFILHLYINTFGDYLDKIYSDNSIKFEEKAILIDLLYEYHDNFDRFEEFLNSKKIEPYHSYLLKKHLLNQNRVDELSELLKNIHPIKDVEAIFYRDCKKRVFSKKLSFQKSLEMIDLEKELPTLFDGCYVLDGYFEKDFELFISNNRFNIYKIESFKNNTKNLIDGDDFKNTQIDEINIKNNHFQIKFKNSKIKPFTIYKFKKNQISPQKIELSESIKKRFPYLFTKYLENPDYIKYQEYKKGDFDAPKKRVLTKLIKDFPDIHLIMPDYFLEDKFTIDEKVALLSYIKDNISNMGILLTWERFFKDWDIFDDKLELIKKQFLLDFYHKEQISPQKNIDLYKKRDISFSDLNINYPQDTPEKDKILNRIKRFEFLLDGKYEFSIEESIFYKTVSSDFYEISYIDFEEKIVSADIYLLYSDGSKIRVHEFITETPFNTGDIYSDYKMRKYDLRGKLESDTLLVAKYKIVSSSKREYFNGFISYFDSLYSKIPINNYELEVIYPKNEKINIFSSTNLKKTTKNINQKTHQIFNIKNIEESISEPFSPPFLQKAPYFVISNINSWNDLAFWFQKLMHHDYTIPENIKKRLFEKIPSTLKREDIIKKIYKFVTNEIRYVGIELGMHSYKPFLPKEIIENRIGDCKDKSILFLSLLKLYGIEGEIVLIRTYDLGKLPSTTPSYLYFNHAIVYLFDEDKYLDLSNYSLPYGELPMDVSNGSGFHITSMKIKTPLLENKSSRKVVSFKISSLEETLNISMSYQYEGFFSDMFRRDIDLITTSKRVELMIQQYYNNPIELSSFDVKNGVIPLFKADFSYIYPKELSLKKFPLFRDGDFFVNRFAPNISEERYYDYQYPYLFEEIYEYQFDSDLEILSFENRVIDNEFFKFESKLKDNKITISFRLKRVDFPYELYSPFRDSLVTIDKYLKKPVFFQKR